MRSFPAICSNLGIAASRFAGDTRAATAIEYAMIAAGIAATVAAAISTVGSTIQNSFYGKLVNATKTP